MAYNNNGSVAGETKGIKVFIATTKKSVYRNMQWPEFCRKIIPERTKSGKPYTETTKSEQLQYTHISMIPYNKCFRAPPLGQKI